MYQNEWKWLTSLFMPKILKFLRMQVENIENIILYPEMHFNK